MLNAFAKALFLLVSINLFKNVCSQDNENDTVVVQLPTGKIQGRILNRYYIFREIPYASPPVGNLRFREPIPPENWDGVLETTNNTKICYQFGGNISSSRENEDCLYLNVYSPVKPGDKALRPVVFYIHGGSFTHGDGTFESLDPEFWFGYAFVIVTMNYRLGPLGFLSTQDEVIPGNNGLKDQLMALQWVNKNIELFGGEPNYVTIMGNGAGAASAGYHLLSKKSSGLFWQAVLQSGTPLCSWAYQKNAKQFAYDFASAIDPSFDDRSNSTKLLEFLKTVPVEQIKSTPFNPDLGLQLGQGNIWAPVMEAEDTENSFITKPMHESLKNGDFNQVQVMIGITSEELITYSANLTSFKNLMAQYDNNISLIVNENFNINQTDLVNAGNAIRQIYTDGRFEDDLGASIRFLSDATYTTCAARHAYLQSNYTATYFYQFSYAGELGNNIYSVEGAEKVQHGSEENYIWRTSRNANLSSFPASDVLTVNRLMTILFYYVKYTNPTPAPMEILDNVYWESLTPDNFTYLNINSSISIRTNPKQYQKWQEIVDTYGNAPFYTY